MENKICIQQIETGSQQIRIDFTATGEIKKYFKPNLSFFTEYNEDVQNVPKGIAVIPFICNILPIVWLTDATLEVDTLDEDFFHSIPEFKKGYMDMHPQMEFKGHIEVSNLEKNIPRDHKTAAYFSGGVDAFATLIAHIEERPTLLTVWGSDVTLDDQEGWNNVKEHIEETSQAFNLNRIYIKSNFREFLENKPLERLVKKSGDNWWHGFHHGIGLLGLSSPIAYAQGFTTIYIASSFTIKEKGLVTCASDPTIDNFVRFCGSHIIHDQYEYARQEKIRHICDFVRKNHIPIRLHVCWISSGGTNCCHCEKCYRTMFGLFAEGVDPKEYGFNYTENELKNSYRNLKYQITFRFSPIQQRFLSNPQALIKPGIEWICNCDIPKLEKSPLRKLFSFSSKVNRKIKSITKKL